MTGPDSATPPRPRLVFVVTDSSTARYLLRGQLAYLAGKGFDVSVICSPGRHVQEVRANEQVRCIEIPIEREISPLRDLASLVELIRALRRLRPHILNASTPKAGLLGLIAGALTRVPYRVRTVRGLRLETLSGWRLSVLSLAERVASRCAHRVICVSESLREAYLRRALAPPAKIVVLGAGSSNGVDVARFRPSSSGGSPELRVRLGLAPHAPEAPVIGFVGRLVRDKGIEDLLRAFECIVLERLPSARLLLLGPAESADPLSDRARAFLRDRAEVIAPGPVDDPSPWYSLMDVVAFPSLREGFPNVPLEAAACGLPVAGYAATGTVDAVDSGRTGTLVPVGDWQALGEAIWRYLDNPELRQSHGRAGRRRVEMEFSNQAVWERWRAFYLDCAGGFLGGHGRPACRTSSKELGTRR